MPETTITAQDISKIKRLVKEGKYISQIVKDDFPNYDYWDVYAVVYKGKKLKSALAVRWLITNRLKKLSNASPQDRQKIIDEISDLTWYLYNNYQANRKKLESIRAVLDK